MKNSNKNRITLGRLLIIVVVTIVLLITIAVVRTIVERHRLDDELTALHQEIEQLKVEQNNFLSALDMYQSDYYIEQAARLKLDLKKDGEKVVVVKLEMPTNNLNNENNSINKSSGQSNLHNWWQYFFGG